MKRLVIVWLIGLMILSACGKSVEDKAPETTGTPAREITAKQPPPAPLIQPPIAQTPISPTEQSTIPIASGSSQQKEYSENQQKLINYLIDYLEKRGSSEDQEIISALKNFNISKIIPILSTLLKDTDKEIRHCAAKALVVFAVRDRETLLEIIRVYEEQCEGNQCLIAPELSELDASEVLPDLFKRLKDDNTETRRKAAIVVGCLRPSLVIPELMNRLKEEPDDNIRFTISIMFGHITVHQPIEEIAELLKHQDWQMRAYAELAIGEDAMDGRLPYDTPKSILPELINNLKDKDEIVRRYAIRALGWLFERAGWKDAKKAIPEIKSLLKDPDNNVRAKAIQTLSEQFAAQEVIPDLIALLNDSATNVRQETARGLWELKAVESVPIMMKILSNTDEDGMVKRWAITIACNFGNKEESVPAIVKLLNDKDYDTRTSAINALEELNAKEAISGLINMLKEVDVRRQALAICNKEFPTPRALVEYNKLSAYARTIDLLVKLDAQESCPELMKLLLDKDEHLRWAAAKALVKLGYKEAIPELSKLLNDADCAARAGAVEALSDSAIPETIPEIIKLLDDEDWTVRKNSVDALCKLNARESIPALLKLLSTTENDNRTLRPALAETLGKLGAMEAIPNLIEILNDQDKDTRFSAANALGNLNAQIAIPALIEMLKDEGNDVSCEFIDIFSKLGAKKAVPQILDLTNNAGHPYVKGFAAMVLVELGAKDQLTDEHIDDIKSVMQDDDKCRNRARAALKELGVTLPESEEMKEKR